MKGLLVDIYSNGSNCSNGGISSRCKSVVLVGEDVQEIFEVTEDHPAVKVITRDLPREPYLTAYPIDLCVFPPNKTGWMFGGTFIYSSDSRFRAISAYPIPLHDRTE